MFFIPHRLEIHLQTYSSTIHLVVIYFQSQVYQNIRIQRPKYQ